MHRILYGLYGVLKLHNAQEEESLFSLLPEDDGPGDGPGDDRLDHIGGVKHPETIGHPD